MKARLVKYCDEYHLLLHTGEIKILTMLDVKYFLSTFDNETHYKKKPTQAPLSQEEMKEYEGETLAIVKDDGHLSFSDSTLLKDLLLPEFCPYLTSIEYADKHGKKRNIVMRLCREGRLPGAVQKGSTWLIPFDTPYPDDARVGKRVQPTKVSLFSDLDK